MGHELRPGQVTESTVGRKVKVRYGRADIGWEGWG